MSEDIISTTRSLRSLVTDITSTHDIHMCIQSTFKTVDMVYTTFMGQAKHTHSDVFCTGNAEAISY